METKTLNIYNLVFESKRFSIHEKKIFFVGVVSDFILSKENFPRNTELRRYAEPYFQLNQLELKDYLLESRTILIARITKIILTTMDFDSCYLLFDYHKSFALEINSLHNENEIDNESNSMRNNLGILDELLKVRLKK